MSKQRREGRFGQSRQLEGRFEVWVFTHGKRGLQVALLLLLGSAGVVRGGESPVAGSPGSPKGTVIEMRCPTFSWGALPGTERFELVVYRVGRDDDGGEGEEPILQERFSGSVSSWTPSLGACLERGGRYAWSVRALVADEASEWSSPNLFEVSRAEGEAELDQALELVRRMLGPAVGEGSSSAATWTPAVSPGALASAASLPSVAVAGDPALVVNGAPVVTVATFGAGLCAALTYRYVDLGDGTVRDCNTGKVWLKDASCLGTGSWSSSSANGSVQKAVELLNSGSQFNCSGYTPGTYTDWQVPAMTAMCGLWNGSCSGTGCCTAGQGLVNGGLSNPAADNAAGDGQWQPGDAFVGVQWVSVGYWSALTAGGSNAWGVWFGGAQALSGPASISGRVWPVRSGL